jgi:predicted nucleotidyltransferase
MNHGLTSDHLRQMQAVLAPYADRIDRVSLFGSRATGTYRPNSDIDLVLHGDVSAELVGRLCTLFQESALPVAVDVKGYDLTAYAPLKRHMDVCMRPLFSQQQLQHYPGRCADDVNK